MATIKEVAKLAGVSLGTVSNVMNGKTQNEEIIQKVEKAIRQLSYRPCTSARSLKNTKTNTIGLILPDVLQTRYRDFLMNLENRFREHGYSLLIKFSRNNELIERKSIEAFLDLRVEGVVVFTKGEQRKTGEWNGGEVPILLVTGHANSFVIENAIVIDYRNAFRNLMIDLKKKGYKRPGLVLQNELLTEGGLKDLYLEYYDDDSLIKVTDDNRERGFQALFELNTLDNKADVLIVGSRDIGIGVVKAKTLLALNGLPVYALKENNWIDDYEVYAGILSIPANLMAQKTTDRMLEMINSSNVDEPKIDYLLAQYQSIQSDTEVLETEQEELHFAMYDCSSANGLEMLSEIYGKQTGQKIVFDKYPYDVLEKMLYEKSEQKDNGYDGFMMDITWMEGLIESGLVKNLDHLLHNKKFLDGYIDGAIKSYGMYIESLFAIPFMSGTQILFFQKDLFEDRTLQISYRRKYGEELKPPENWRQFNSIAKFFTREYNPESKVEYGISMPIGENVYTAIEFLNRLWAYGGNVFDADGNICIKSMSTINAMKSMMQSYQYSSRRNLNSWNDIASEFGTGKTAMVILYNSDVGDINNYTKSKVTGNLGFCKVPGGTPVLGGWSIGLNRYGLHQQEAEQFLLWATGSPNSIPLALLGGATLKKEYYESSDLDNLEPWKYMALESSYISKRREMPELLDDSRWKNKIYTELIPREIMKVYRGEITEIEAAENMEKEITKFISEH